MRHERLVAAATARSTRPRVSAGSALDVQLEPATTVGGRVGDGLEGPGRHRGHDVDGARRGGRARRGQLAVAVRQAVHARRARRRSAVPQAGRGSWSRRRRARRRRARAGAGGSGPRRRGCHAASARPRRRRRMYAQAAGCRRSRAFASKSPMLAIRPRSIGGSEGGGYVGTWRGSAAIGRSIGRQSGGAHARARPRAMPGDAGRRLVGCAPWTGPRCSPASATRMPRSRPPPPPWTTPPCWGALPGWTGWTRKDVLAHVEWWNDHSVRVIEALLAGREPYDRGGPWDTDVQNARILAENRDRDAGRRPARVRPAPSRGSSPPSRLPRRRTCSPSGGSRGWEPTGPSPSSWRVTPCRTTRSTCRTCARCEGREMLAGHVLLGDATARTAP